MADSSGDESEAHAPPSTVELLLQQIMAKQEQMEERSTRRFVAMQATIDAQGAALTAANAAQPGASIWAAPAAPAEGGWLRRIASSAITPTAAAPIAPNTVPPAPRPASVAATLAVLGKLPTAPVPLPVQRPPLTAAASGAAAATSIAAIAARARARAANKPAAPVPVDIDIDADGDRDEYFDALDEQYDLLTAAPDPDRSLADRFGGHPLPIQHLGKFWPRAATFQETTCHYHPAIAGDTLNGKLVDKLEALGAKQHAAKQPEYGTQYAYELRTLIAAVSYLTDASVQQQLTTASVLDALKDAGSMPAGLESLPQDSIDMAVQLKSILSHLKERVDILRAASRQAHVDVEIFARLYDSEDRIAGDRSDLGAAVEARSIEGATRKMISQSASERVAAAVGGSKLTPRGPPPREQSSGGLSRSARDRARKLQPVGGRQAGR